MSENNQESMLFDALESLANSVVKLVNSLRESKEIEPSENICFRETYVTDEGEAGNLHVDKSLAARPFREFYQKTTWFGASRKITELIVETEEYKALCNLIPNKDDIQFLVPQFIHLVTTSCLESPGILEHNFTKDIEILILRFFARPVPLGVASEVIGIEIEDEGISIEHANKTTILRKPLYKDFELDCDALRLRFPNIKQLFDEYPSLIMEISACENPENANMQKENNRAICLLRLFNVGSVNYLHLKFESTAYNYFGGGVISQEKGLRSIHKYSIGSSHVKRLKSFWAFMHDLIPENIYWSGASSESPISIAYNRYSDAIFDKASIERRIATAVMGLESLWSENKPELKYSLTHRMGKLLKIFGLSPRTVKLSMYEAYDIRSKYAHGGAWPIAKQTKTLEKLQLQSMEELWLRIMDYLRISIIIGIFLGIFTEKAKEEPMRHIDDALIEYERECTLRRLLTPLKPYIFSYI